jgi:hypothetical protein
MNLLVAVTAQEYEVGQKLVTHSFVGLVVNVVARLL